jgi:hypothetical protein
MRCNKCVTQPILRQTGRIDPDMICPVCKQEYSTNPNQDEQAAKRPFEGSHSNESNPSSGWWRGRTLKRKRGTVSLQ